MMEMADVDVTAPSVQPTVGRSRGSIDFATLQLKTWNHTAAIGLSVKVQPVEFFFEGDKLPHFRCPPGTRRAGKWTDKLGTDCELGGARVALARIGERMQRVAHSKPGKNEDLPSIGQRVEFRLGHLADRLDPNGGKKKPGRGVATAFEDAANALDGGKGKKPGRGVATALEDAANALDGGKGKKRPGRGVATALEDAANALDGGKGGKRPKVRRRRIAEPLPSGKRVDLSKPDRPKTPSAVSRARTATEDTAAKVSVDRSARRREILNALNDVANVDAERRHMIDINRNAPKFLKERNGGGKWEDPAYLDRAVQRRERIRKALVKHRDEIDALLERDRKENTLTKEERQALHKRAANIELYIEKNDNHIDQIRSRIKELEQKPPSEPKSPVKKAAPVKKVAKKAVPGKKAVKKGVKKKAVAKRTGTAAVVQDGASPARQRLSTKKPTAAPDVVSTDPMLGGNFESVVKNITDRQRARQWDSLAARNLAKNRSELIDAANGSDFNRSDLEKLANQHGKQAMERQALENRLAQLEHEFEVQDKLDFQDRAVTRNGTARFRGFRAREDEKRLLAIQQRERALKDARDAEKKAWGSQPPQRFNDVFPRIAPNESVNEFLRRVEQEKLARGWDQQVKNHEAAVVKIDEHLVKRAEAARQAGFPKDSQGNGLATINSFINDLEQVVERNRAAGESLRRRAEEHRRNMQTDAASVADNFAAENERAADLASRELKKLKAARERLGGKSPSVPEGSPVPGVSSGAEKAAAQQAKKVQPAVRKRVIDKRIKLKRERPANFGLAGEVQTDGIVKIKAVPIGNKGITSVEQARDHLANGGDVADIPDVFLREMFVGKRAEAPQVRGGEIPIKGALAGRWKARVPAQGAIGDNLLIFDGEKPQGFFLKGASPQEDAAGMAGHALAHQMGIPVVPARYDGRDRDPRRGVEHRYVMYEHGFNAVDAFDGPFKYYNEGVAEANRDPAHLYGFEARIPHALANMFMQVDDRNVGNGLIGRDKDGNWVAVPIDMDWANGANARHIEDYMAFNIRFQDAEMQQGFVGNMIQRLPQDQRADARKRIRAVIKQSRDNAQKFYEQREQFARDHLQQLRDLGADEAEIAGAERGLSAAFFAMKDVLDANSLDAMYAHFGVN